MRKKIIKERILDSLLESSKTTGELATKLEYFNSKGHPACNVTSNDLEILKKMGTLKIRK
jgi:hypothetical protein